MEGHIPTKKNRLAYYFHPLLMSRALSDNPINPFVSSYTRLNVSTNTADSFHRDSSSFLHSALSFHKSSVITPFSCSSPPFSESRRHFASPLSSSFFFLQTFFFDNLFPSFSLPFFCVDQKMTTFGANHWCLLNLKSKMAASFKMAADVRRWCLKFSAIYFFAQEDIFICFSCNKCVENFHVENHKWQFANESWEFLVAVKLCVNSRLM